MPALVRSTKSFNKVDKMTQDLLNELPVEYMSDSIGFLSCDPGAAYIELLERIQEKTPFAIVGGTSLASPLCPREEEVGATLTVFSSNRIRFAASLSSPLGGDCAAQMKSLYEDCVAGLGTEPKLFFIIMPIVPDLAADRYLSELFALVGEIPVFGGMVSDDFDAQRSAVFFNESAYSDRIALIAFGGDVRPALGVGCSLTMLSEYAPTVTETDDHVIRRVDDMTFCDYLRKLGFDPDDPRIMSDWLLSISVQGHFSDIDGIAECSVLVDIDPREGSGLASCRVPEGTRIGMGFLSKSDVLKSAEGCLDRVANEIDLVRNDGYEYEMAFCVSCVSRYYALVGNSNLEGNLLKSRLPSGIPMFGYYGFNEICPTRGKDGSLFNRPHGESLVVCVI